MSAKTYTNLTETYDMDNAVIEFEYVEYLDENSNEPNKAGIRTFNTRDEDIFLLPYKAILEVRGQIMTVANPPAEFAVGAEVVLINNG